MNSISKTKIGRREERLKEINPKGIREENKLEERIGRKEIEEEIKETKRKMRHPRHPFHGMTSYSFSLLSPYHYYFRSVE